VNLFSTTKRVTVTQEDTFPCYWRVLVPGMFITIMGIQGVCFATDTVPDFIDDVMPIFVKYCTGCHSSDNPEGSISLEAYEDLGKGPKDHPLIVPGNSVDSHLIRILKGDGQPTMPPEGYEAPSSEEIDLISKWIKNGATPPQGLQRYPPALTVPYIAPLTSDGLPAITAIAMSNQDSLLAMGRFATVQLLELESRQLLHSIEDLPGKVNSLHFSNSSDHIVVATGVGGLFGQANLYDVRTAELLLSFMGHNDLLYAAKLSPDGSILATGSYDSTIILWSTKTGEKLKALNGHNGAVLDLAFNKTGQVLASASADETIKLWDTKTGDRIGTLSQPEAEQVAVLFSPDDKFILAGGADSRIRIWQFGTRGMTGANHLVQTLIAHEGSVTDLAFANNGKTLITTGEDRLIKCWETINYETFQTLPKRSSLIASLSGSLRQPRFAVSQMNGTWEMLDIPEINVRSRAEANGYNRSQAIHSKIKSELAIFEEREPNDSPNQATPISAPCVVKGEIKPTSEHGPNDYDFFRFQAKAHQAFIVEIKAAEVGSSLDSKVEVLTNEGERIERVLLQAVRDSYLTYSGRDSETSDDFRFHGWQEMEINEYIYLNGEVMKLWQYPRGVDSGYMVYPGTGKRYSYFGTTPITHALNETAYIVVPKEPDSALLPNGLPVFPIYFENDDDPRRRLGTDSYLEFTAPEASEYLIRVSDIRGFSGENFHYELTLRAPEPDFVVTFSLDDSSINPGSGREFQLTADRIDGFEGEITVEITGLPNGFQVTSPVIIQAEQSHAYGTIYANEDASRISGNDNTSMRIISSAIIDGELIKKTVSGLNSISLGQKPKFIARLSPLDSPSEMAVSSKNSIHAKGIPEVFIEPGSTISAKVQVDRQDGFGDEISFGGNIVGRNLPHGVFIDNVGLNGLLISAGRDEREFVITAARWVPETSRMFHLRAEVDGNQTTWPMMLHVRRAQE